MPPPSTALIRDVYARRSAEERAVVSIELFPPKTPASLDKLFTRTLPELQSLKPDYYSVTYGAGGSTRDQTLAIADRIQREQHTPTMAHLTCIATPRAEIERYLREAQQRGVRNILALRGDPPQNADQLAQLESGFEYSYQLVSFIRQMGDFSIGTAGFPECHIDCTEGKQVDWQRLKAKIDAGADFVLTQLFFDNDAYFEFRDYMVATLGTDVPITPGVLPILSTARPLQAKLEAFGDDASAVTAFGIEYATRQCEALLSGGAPGLHLYSLNKSHAPVQIIGNLGLKR